MTDRNHKCILKLYSN